MLRFDFDIFQLNVQLEEGQMRVWMAAQAPYPRA